MRQIAMCLTFLVSATSSYAQVQTPPNPPTLTLPTPLVLAIANYLQQRPHIEVAQILADMQKAIAPQLMPSHNLTTPAEPPSTK